jgi:hypothetical protein
MLRSLRLLRFPLALAAAASLSGCEASIDWSFVKDLLVDTTQTSITTSVPVDLTQYSEVQQHKTNVTHFNLTNAVITVKNIGAANKATKVTGTVVLHPTGAVDASQDVTVGSLNNYPIGATSTLTLPGNAKLDTFLTNQIKGPGKFDVLITGTTDGEAHFTLGARLNVNLGYGIF